MRDALCRQQQGPWGLAPGGTIIKQGIRAPPMLGYELNLGGGMMPDIPGPHVGGPFP